LIKETEGGFLISQIKQIQGRIFEKLLSQAGIEEFNGAQGRILYILWQTDYVPIVELSKKTGLAKTTLTSMLDRLETKGLICRNFDKSDRRQVKISLTEKAKALSEDYNRVSMQMNEIFYKGFSDNEIVQLEKLLNIVVQNLKDCGEYKWTN
jgi:DNA-binding MarR family transcriptional regulator